MPRYKNTTNKVFISTALNRTIKPDEEVETTFELPRWELVDGGGCLQKIDDYPLADKDYYEQITVPANSSVDIEFDPRRYVSITLVVNPDNPPLTTPLKVIENDGGSNDETYRYQPLDENRAYQYNNYRYRKTNIFMLTVVNDNSFDVKVDVYYSTAWV
jgi:hypothetical protein